LTSLSVFNGIDISSEPFPGEVVKASSFPHFLIMDSALGTTFGSTFESLVTLKKGRKMP